MNIGNIISNSLKYPFRNLKKLPILFILFILFSFIPIGVIYDNKYVLTIGAIAFFAFILIVPGYLLSIVNIGLNESSMFPSIDFGKNIYDTIRVLVLRIAYMIVPAAVFYVVLSTMGVSSIGMLADIKVHSFLLNLILMIFVVLITYVVFEILLFFAKARLAYFNSLSEALKVHKVVSDIRNIGIFNIIKWVIFMVILMIVVSYISSWLMLIPYVGFLIYLGIVIPILESIGNYSLGLLYSNIADNDNSLDKLESTIQSLEYNNYFDDEK
ncbi:DUF4013 domain-containing protein [uncultured Methanobrevibacter sp.]|uniref:DUF4013 domain-containing protein n=1 Tax=uncultured Methanobrevibacter sp. TaxID=253161 RepID=UPI00260ACD3A|nr:DUF4013 domain-containing protein [uncultured Methanobrevibacter sp.]